MVRQIKPNRRQALAAISAAGAVTALMPGLGLAAGRADRRFVFVILRGGLDGLAAVPPWADRDYISARQGLALDPPSEKDGVLNLDGFFGLHPALAPLMPFWSRRELAVIHAVATPYRERSHFDAQSVLENGSTDPHILKTGWLNRAVLHLGGNAGSKAMAFGSGIPLTLAGDAPVGSWSPSNFIPAAPSDFLTRVNGLWRRDSLLGPALAEGIAMQVRSDELLQGASMKSGKGRPAGSAGAFQGIASLAGKMMAAPDGPGIAVMEAGGWDTHAQQGRLTGRLAGNLEQFCAGLTSLASAMAPVWDRTIVMVASEFGRTVGPNGTEGTDHGTAGVAFLLGGAVAGGKVLGDWPGLAMDRLHEGRDLRPANDIRAVLKAVLREHLGIDAKALDETVFPSSSGVAMLRDVVRA